MSTYIQENLPFLTIDEASCASSVNLSKTGADCGVVYTAPEAVSFMLDLVGYTPNRPLFKYSILEPSFGHGAFLVQIVARLIQSCLNFNYTQLDKLSSCIKAIEIEATAYKITKGLIQEQVSKLTQSSEITNTLLSAWLVQSDFLLTDIAQRFDFIIGNPPYIRIENISPVSVACYRKKFATFSDRADIYIPFYEKGLSLLKESGCLSFLCTNRWMKNKYGRKLRQFIVDNYSVDYVIDITSDDLFDRKVTTYPAITLISNVGTTLNKSETIYFQHIGTCKKLDKSTLKGLKVALPSSEQTAGHPWIWENEQESVFHHYIENAFPSIEETGCKVSIGVATGADKIFIGRRENFPVETSRLIPIATSKDVNRDRFEWHGGYIINPYNENGELVNLDNFPLLQAYFEKHKKTLSSRYCAKKQPTHWFKTIDKIYPTLVAAPKILIPDIKDELTPIIDSGHFYPHHNLYYILPGAWDIEVLYALLLSDFCAKQIKRRSTVINGGAYRFQAQYIRRLRIPQYHQISDAYREKLKQAAHTRNRAECNLVVNQLIKNIYHKTTYNVH